MAHHSSPQKLIKVRSNSEIHLDLKKKLAAGLNIGHICLCEQCSNYL